MEDKAPKLSVLGHNHGTGFSGAFGRAFDRVDWLTGARPNNGGPGHGTPVYDAQREAYRQAQAERRHQEVLAAIQGTLVRRPSPPEPPDEAATQPLPIVNE